MNRVALSVSLGLILLAPGARAQRNERLSSAAQAAVDRGIAAAEQSDWSRAIAEFTEAQKAAPTNPLILYNLGLAYDNIGHDLPAMGWLRSYLAAAPRAENSSTVSDRIGKLKAAAKAKLKTIFDSAREAARRLDLDSDSLEHAVENMAYDQARAEDFDGARETAKMSPPVSERIADIIRFANAKQLAEHGDVDRAGTELGNVKNLSYFYRALIPGKKDPSRSEAEDRFWVAVSTNLSCCPWGTSCYAMNFTAARQAAMKIRTGYSRDKAMDELEHREYQSNRDGASSFPGRQCSDLTTTEIWVEFAKDMSEKDSPDAELTKISRSSSDPRYTKSTPDFLAHLGGDIGESLRQYHFLEKKLGRN